MGMGLTIPFLPRSSFFLSDFGRAGFTVFRSVGCGVKELAAFSTELAAFLQKDLAVEGFVAGQDGTTIPFADE